MEKYTSSCSSGGCLPFVSKESKKIRKHQEGDEEEEHTDSEMDEDIKRNDEILRKRRRKGKDINEQPGGDEPGRFSSDFAGIKELSLCLLPGELLLCILDYLTVEELIQASKVCQKFRKLVRTPLQLKSRLAALSIYQPRYTLTQIKKDPNVKSNSTPHPQN